MKSTTGGNDGTIRLFLDNIGENGKNLTIAVLSMNRSSLTIRLMKSVAEWIPYFEGKVLIGDNGSSQEELKQLKIAASATPFDCTIIEFGQNFGVAGGRNRLFRAVETDWLMSLDNDLYFTSNPLPQVMRDINRLGVQFLGLPLVNKENKDTGIYGGHLFLEALEGRPAIGIGSSYRFKNVPINMPADGFLCTGLAGGCAIINKHSFSRQEVLTKECLWALKIPNIRYACFKKGIRSAAAV